MSELAFGSTPTYASDVGFDISVSGDRQVFAIRFSRLEAVVGAGRSPAPMAARVFSLVLPMKGRGDSVDVSLAFSGFAHITEGASGYTVFSVNGISRVERLVPRVEGKEFVHELNFDITGTPECRLFAFLQVERDSAYRDAAAHLNIVSIDAAIKPRGWPAHARS